MLVTKQAAAAGIAAAVLFALSVTVFGTLFVFTPVLPLLAIGYAKGRDATFIAAALGALFLSPFGIDALLVYAATSAVPSALWIAATGRETTAPNQGRALTEIVLFAGVVAIALHLSLTPLGGLEEVMMAYIEQGLANADPRAFEVLEKFPYLPAASAAWWFVLVFYVHTRITLFLLAQMSVPPVLPEAKLTAFMPSRGLLYALPLLLIAAIIEGNHSFIAGVLFLIFLLPYTVAGFITAHSKLKAMRGGALMLALLYIASFVLVWPVVVIASVGIWQHLRQLGLIQR